MFKNGLRLHGFLAGFDTLGLKPAEAGIIIALLTGLALAEMCSFRRRCPVPEIFRERHCLLRYSAVFFLLFLLLIFGMYGPSYDNSKMIYMQF